MHTSNEYIFGKHEVYVANFDHDTHMLYKKYWDDNCCECAQEGGSDEKSFTMPPKIEIPPKHRPRVGPFGRLMRLLRRRP